MDPILHTFATLAIMYVTWKAGYWYGSYVERIYALQSFFDMFNRSLLDQVGEEKRKRKDEEVDDV